MKNDEIEFQRFDAFSSPLSRVWHGAVTALTVGSALLAGADAAGLLGGRYLPDFAEGAAPWRAHDWIADGARLGEQASLASGLALAPLDGAGWLALARMDLRSRADRMEIARGLKSLALAFDTAPHAANLARTRLALAVLGPDDQTLALAAGRDLRALFAKTNAPQALMDELYALAGPEGRKLLEALALKDVTIPSAVLPEKSTAPAAADVPPKVRSGGKSKPGQVPR